MYPWDGNRTLPLGNLILDYMRPDLRGIPIESARNGQLVAIADRLDSDILEEESFTVRVGDGSYSNSYSDQSFGVSTLNSTLLDRSTHSGAANVSGAGPLFMSPNSGLFYRGPRSPAGRPPSARLPAPGYSAALPSGPPTVFPTAGTSNLSPTTTAGPPFIVSQC